MERLSSIRSRRKPEPKPVRRVGFPVGPVRQPDPCMLSPQPHKEMYVRNIQNIQMRAVHTQPNVGKLFELTVLANLFLALQASCTIYSSTRGTIVQL